MILNPLINLHLLSPIQIPAHINVIITRNQSFFILVILQGGELVIDNIVHILKSNDCMIVDGSKEHYNFGNMMSEREEGERLLLLMF